MTPPIQEQPADLPMIPNADRITPVGAPAVPISSTVPARRGLESDSTSPTRKHLSRHIRRGEPRDDGP
jgi:hypothetical protein